MKSIIKKFALGIFGIWIEIRMAPNGKNELTTNQHLVLDYKSDATLSLYD